MADRHDVEDLFGNFNNPRLDPPQIIPFSPPTTWRSIGELTLRVLDRLSVDGQEEIEQ